MLPDRVSNPGPLTCESGALPIALRGPNRFSDRRTSVPGVCNYGYFPLRHIGNTVMRIEIMTKGFQIDRYAILLDS